ncbi:MAG TPA: hypothetical protein DDZ51_30810 [Planctomycetaceae bacterium]|nr:hypothetical protein [Planctomycetaceae bacterium]
MGGQFWPIRRSARGYGFAPNVILVPQAAPVSGVLNVACILLAASSRYNPANEPSSNFSDHD